MVLSISDRGMPLQQISTNVMFLITDINEFPPVFSLLEDATSAISTAPVGTSLLQVVATDADGGDNDITYSIVNRDENGLNFTVDADGVISNDAPLGSPRVCV